MDGLEPMNRLLKSFALTTAVLLLASHRCPAPIQEVQETPTPNPTLAVQSTAVPKPQPTPIATPVGVPSTAGAARYAGTWTGKINMQKLGDVNVTLVISADGTSVQMNSKMSNAGRPLTYHGKLLSWLGGARNNIPWTLTLNPDGGTALVTRTFSGTTTIATFKRVATESGNNVTPSRPGKKGKRP